MRGIKLIVYPVNDLDQAKTLYSAMLGVEPYAESPYYVGFRIGDQEIGLDPNGHNAGLSGPLNYWAVDDIAASLRTFLDAGAQERQAVTDVGGGKRIASVTDADGNVIALVESPPAS